MASSSASSVVKSFKYDVFLSFCGEDTRHTLVDHLYNALQQKGVCTYKDDEKIKKGKRIIDDLFTSIEDSRFYIIVFSKSYASSSWCLKELVKIMECQKMTEHTAFPIFYHVEPTEVRKQSGKVGRAFAKHENEEAAGEWRDALEDASSLAGWEYKNNGENKFIQQIVHEISLELRSINFIVDEKLIGMETRMSRIVSSLETSSDDVRMFGIVGMGGAGKTTLARAVFEKISFLFEGKSFVENVREVSNSSSGLRVLQKQVISDVLNDQSITVSNVFDGKNQIRKVMRCRKVLVILDDVDRIEQLEALAGDCNWFKPGSRILITTRDRKVLLAHNVLFCDVSLLSKEEAICLLSRYAFGKEAPIEGYKGLSRKVVDYAAGLPLTIKVLGSKLCGEDDHIWRAVIERIKEIPLAETLKMLEISYDDLEEEHKEIFLDVACIMKGWKKDEAIRALDSYGCHGRYGLRILELKSLITIYSSDSNDVECLGMHDHIVEMGQNIVRRHGKPHTHSRLWKDEEIEEILAKDLGTEATRCIKLTMKTNPKIDMKGFGKMENLRFLHLSLREDKDEGGDDDEDEDEGNFEHEVYSEDADEDEDEGNFEHEVYFEDEDEGNFEHAVCFENEDEDEGNFEHAVYFEDEVIQYFPDALRCLFWVDYPFRCLPNTFRAINLVRLEMPFYRGEQLWESGGRKVLYNLKFLVLHNSSLRTLDVRVTPNLEMLCLASSEHLKELHMPNKLKKLKSLNLQHSALESFDLGKTPNLETVCLSACDNLKELHMLDECPKLESLVIFGLKSLKALDLCQGVNLKELEVRLCEDLVKLNMPVRRSKLKNLNIDYCLKLSTFDLGLAPNLENMVLRECRNLVEVHMHVGYPKLRSLHLVDLPNLRTLDFAMTPNLEYLWLSGCKDLVLKMPLKFPRLEALQLENCSMLKTLRLQIPSLKSLEIDSYHLTDGMLGDCPMLKELFLRNIPDVPLYLGGLCCLEELTFTSTKMKHFPDIICLLQGLKFLKFEYCSLLEKLPENLDRLECLEKLTLWACKSLQDIPSSIGKMKSLQHLCLWGCTAVEKLPEELGSLEYLIGLDITNTGITHLPQSSVHFRHLHITGSELLLESYQFTSEEHTSVYGRFYRRGPCNSRLYLGLPKLEFENWPVEY